MAQSQNWIELVGRHLKYIYQRLDNIEHAIRHLDEEVQTLEASKEKAETDLRELRERILTKEEFDNFVEDITNTLLAIPFPQPPSEKSLSTAESTPTTEDTSDRPQW